MKNGWPKLGGLLGIAYCIAGFFLIFLGWNGAASHDREPAQIPYVISGGIAGLGLVVLGAALIVAHSLRTDRVELRGSIDDLRAGNPVHSTRGPQLCTWREAERVLAGFPDDRADEGPTAGPASLAGLTIARENGWTAGTGSSRTGSSTTELSKGENA